MFDYAEYNFEFPLQDEAILRDLEDTEPSKADVAGSEASDGENPRRVELETKLTTLQAEINAAQAQQVAHISEHLAFEFWGDHVGINSEATFLTWQLGQSPSEASVLVKIATGLEERPLIKTSFSKGELSLGQVRILIDISEPETEEQLVDLALGLSGAQLTRFATHYKTAIKSEEDNANERRFLRTNHSGDGSWTINGRLASEQGAIIERALAAARNAMIEEREGLDDEAWDPWEARDADALVSVADSYLNGGGVRKPHERHTVVIHADVEVVAGMAEGLGRIEGGGIVSGGTIEKLLKGGASVVEMISKDGNILQVDRKKRSPGVPLRRALQSLEMCCSFPPCSKTTSRDAHHIEFYGPTKDNTVLENLVLPCPSHHRLIHSGEVSVEMTPEGPVYRDSSGKVIERKRLEAQGLLEELNRARGVEVDAFTCLPDWNGEQGDLRYVADIYSSNRYELVMGIPVSWGSHLDRSSPVPKDSDSPENPSDESTWLVDIYDSNLLAPEPPDRDLGSDPSNEALAHDDDYAIPFPDDLEEAGNSRAGPGP